MDASNPIDGESVVLIVGASRGIGLEFVKQCLARNAHVIATTRKTYDHLKTLSCDKLKVIPEIDVADPSSYGKRMEEFFSAHNDMKVTHIIHNAGVFGRRIPFSQTTTDDLFQVYAVNVIGVLGIFQSILPYVSSLGCVWAVLSSQMGSIRRNFAGGAYAYRSSKAALNMLCKNVAIDFKDRVGVVILHPGYVATDMNAGMGPIQVDESVGGMMKQIDDTNKNSAIRFVSWEGEIIPW